MDWLNRNLASARNVASATGPIPPYSTVAYIIMQFCHFCGMHSFVSGPLFQFAALQQHTNCPAGRAPVRAVSAAALPAPATSRGAVRPSSPPAQTAASFKLAVVAAASADACFTTAAGTHCGSAPAAAMSRALACVAVVDVFFSAAVPAGGARRCHVPRARWRRCCGRLRHHSRPHRYARSGQAGKLPKAYRIMLNAATWKMNRYLCSAKIGEQSLDPILMQICKIAETRKCPWKILRKN